eukprot:CAMPEP_0181250572 /NCGR_PEP_ID=MMETSP1096-20121128/46396_1 /TAXON_ID=156174 ORGANISM="Chrysochromulina ericina, Strain CCMP281" /NCGR_SAMPLE_ID=MMETSP1096 /ASSEMBLY_ACC=CAM_ASM_000453 /LENGTH=238 /DNA_ID=CAMNT_0023348059 /DNA_START=83 /DNA_END=800 /DNA_ORIENTATION=-
MPPARCDYLIAWHPVTRGIGYSGGLVPLAAASTGAKALAVPDGNGEPITELAPAHVGRHREQVEARVRMGQLHRVVIRPLEYEVQLTEATDRGAIAAGGEGEEGALVVSLKGVDYFPEVQDCRVGLAEAVIFRITLQRFEVEMRRAHDEFLEFAGGKEGECDPITEEQEPFLKRGERLSHRVDQQVLYVEPDVFVTVGVRHRHRRTAWDQLVSPRLAKDVVGNREIGHEDRLHIAVKV